jgi:hypothetical protein
MNDEINSYKRMVAAPVMLRSDPAFVAQTALIHGADNQETT